MRRPRRYKTEDERKQVIVQAEFDNIVKEDNELKLKLTDAIDNKDISAIRDLNERRKELWKMYN